MYIDLELNKIYDKEQFNNIINEMVTKHLNNNPELIEKVAIECIKGAIKSQINGILQSADYRNYLRDKILKQLNIKEI